VSGEPQLFLPSSSELILEESTSATGQNSAAKNDLDDTCPFSNRPPRENGFLNRKHRFTIVSLLFWQVGRPGQSGLSVEQRKRLTIAVELVANPSIVFMDEPTSGHPFPPKCYALTLSILGLIRAAIDTPPFYMLMTGVIEGLCP
jgi:hypothetical protein